MLNLLSRELALEEDKVPSQVLLKQGPTRHRPMAHLVVSRYLSFYTSVADHGMHICSCLFSEMSMSDGLKRWRHDHGPTNVGAMVNINCRIL